MNIQIEQAPIEQKLVVERLMQLYLYDFSELEGFDIGHDGLFEGDPLDSYWTETDRYVFLISAADRMVGFALINSYTCLEENSGAKSIAEFFVMRAFRRQGIGKAAARRIFDMFPGKWEVRQIRSNVGGRQFWRNVIDEYTGGHFTEIELDDDKWKGPTQSFDTGRTTG